MALKYVWKICALKFEITAISTILLNFTHFGKNFRLFWITVRWASFSISDWSNLHRCHFYKGFWVRLFKFWADPTYLRLAGRFWRFSLKPLERPNQWEEFSSVSREHVKVEILSDTKDIMVKKKAIVYFEKQFCRYAWCQMFALKGNYTV